MKLPVADLVAIKESIIYDSEESDKTSLIKESVGEK